MKSHMPSEVLSTTINRSFERVASFLVVPENFTHWAAGMGIPKENHGDEWTVVTPVGDAKVVFTPPNDLGVADHTVYLPDGQVVHVPVRAVRNNDATDVQLTLFRQPSMSDADFERDKELVRKDLKTLKDYLERHAP